jgi:hypothetical protein
MPGDIISHKGRHRGRPALVARRQIEHQGATVDWDPKAELERVDQGEPEETPGEAAVREAAEIVDHRAAEYARFEAEVRSWFDELVANDPIAKQLLAEERERLARKASVEAANEADVPTGEWPLVRELVTAC